MASILQKIRTWQARRLLAKFQTPRDLARAAFHRYAHRIAVMEPGRSITYEKLGERTYQIASAWRRLGLAVGDVVAVRLPDGICQLEARLAAAEAGAVLTMVGMWASAEQVVACLPVIEPKVFVHDGSDPALCARLSALFPQLIQLQLDETQADWLKLGLAQACPDYVAPQATLSLGFTSGTTGVPKVITATCGIYLTSIRLMVDNIGLGNFSAVPDVVLVGIPLCGAGSGVVLPNLLAGGCLVVPASYDAPTLLDLVEKHRPTRLFTTPSLFIDILDDPTLARRDLSSSRNLIYGTESMPVAKLREGLERFGPILQQGHGSAEVLPPVTMLQPHDHCQHGRPAPDAVLMSSGRVVPQVRVRIVDDNLVDVPPGTPGDVLVNSPTLFDGYWKRPDLTSANVRDGFLHMGDMGMLSADGYLTILGRKPDLLHSVDGAVIYPRLVEEALHQHPAVKEANFVQGPNGTVMAFSLRQAWRQQRGPGAWDAELAAHLRERVPARDLPNSYLQLDELPRSPLGKVLRRGVREHVATHTAAVLMV